MTIRIPDSMFARSSGETGAPGELDYETRSALAALRSTEKEMTALNRGLGLAGEALKSGEKVQERLLAAGKALGAQGNGGALRWLLDHVAAERARQEAAASRRSALRTLTGTLKGVGSLPIPFARKAELGRALLRRAVERGLVAPREQELFEAAALSQFGLIEAQSAIAKAVEPGEAPAIVAAAKAEGGLLPVDAALLDRQALERDAVASARHRGRLAWKEQDDLAAFARGELPEPLSEESFRIIHGAAAAAGAQARYDTARREGEALALIRGKDTDAIEAAQAAWQGDPAVFAAAVAKDQAERRRDPAGYALATVPGTAAALEEAPEAERGALLWSAQAVAGIPEGQRSPWTLAQEEAMADAWDALPDGFAGRNEKLGFFRKHLLGLPLRLAAMRRMVQQGIADGTEAELRQVIDQLEGGRFNPARSLIPSLTPWRGAEQPPQASRRAQHAQKGESDERRPEPADAPAPETTKVTDQTKSARPDNPGDPWPAGPETETAWRAAVPLPGGIPRDRNDRQQIAELITDLSEGSSEHKTERASRDLGIYFEEWPEYRDWLVSLSETANSGEPFAVNGVDIDARGAAALLRQQSKDIESGAQPKVWNDPNVLQNWNKLWQVVNDGRKEDLPLAADFLQHYLEGSDRAYEVGLDRLFDNALFQTQFEVLQGYFLAWMTGELLTQTPSEEIGELSG